MKVNIPVLTRKQLRAHFELNENRSAFADPVDDQYRKPRKPPPPAYGADCDSDVGTG